LAEREGFEPSVPLGTHDFQSCPFGQLGHLSRILSLFPFRDPVILVFIKLESGSDRIQLACSF
jgi:hypothetical protein